MRVDGDSALLGFLFSVGLVPAAADVASGRRLGGGATLGLLLAGWALFSLAGRARLLARAAALRRQLLAGGRTLL